MGKKYLIILIIAFSQSVSAQSIIGKVLDHEAKPLEFASIMLLAKKDSALIAFQSSGTDGSFEFKNQANGAYILQVSLMSFESFWKPVNIVSNEDQILEDIKLKPRTTELQNLVVSGYASPIEFSKDTVNYNADAFKTKPGDMVEDLLKKMPGLEVERDGTVKAFGENVKKVLVDGKEFFGNDTRIATKNLDAAAVEQVQVFDKKSDMTEFTGIDDGQEERTINLKLKPGHKAGYFGSAEIQGGTNERFKARANINRFTPKNRLSFIGIANNINEQNFSMNDYMQFRGGLSGMLSGGSMDFGSLTNNAAKGVQRSLAAGINFSTDLSKKTSLTASTFFNDFNSFVTNKSERENFIQNSKFDTEASETDNSNSFSNNFNARIRSKISLTHQLTFNLTGGFGNNSVSTISNSQSLNAETIKLNENFNNRSVKGNSFQLNPMLTYLLKLNKNGRSLAFNGSTNISNSTSNALIDSRNTFFVPSNFTRSINQNQLSKNKNLNFSLKTTFIEPLKNKLTLEASISLSDQVTDSKTDFYDIISEKLIFNNDISRLFRRDYLSSAAQASIRSNKEKNKLQIGVSAENALLKGLILPGDTKVSNTFRAILPYLRYEHEFSRSKNLSINYNTDMIEPTVNQLQPIINNTDLLNIYKGNPDLNNEYKHNVSFNFRNYNMFDFRMFYIFGNLSLTQNKINNAFTISENLVRTTTPINSGNEQTANINTEYSSPIKPLKIKFKIGARTNYSRGISKVNDVFNSTQRIGRGLNFSIENRKKEPIDVVLGVRWFKNNSDYKQSPLLNQFYVEKSIFIEGDFTLSKNISFKSKFENIDYSQSFSSQNINVPMWTAGLTANLSKNNKLRLTATAFDILNRNKGLFRSSTLTYNEIRNENVLGQYFMIGLSYNLKGFKKTEGISFN